MKINGKKIRLVHVGFKLEETEGARAYRLFITNRNNRVSFTADVYADSRREAIEKVTEMGRRQNHWVEAK